MYYLNPLGDCDPEINRGSNDDFPEHFHDNFEIVFIEAGERSAVIDGHKFNEPEKSLTVIFPFQLHGFSGSGGKCSWIGIHPEAMFAHKDTLFGKCPTRPVIPESELSGHAKALTTILMSGDITDKTELNALTVALFCEISDLLCLEERKCCSVGSGLFPLLAAHILDSGFTQEKLARITGISERILYDFFTDGFGMSFSAFIRKYRVDTAAQVLRSGKDISITELAYDCGFSSIRTFNRCFRAEYGMSPVEYAKNDLR